MRSAVLFIVFNRPDTTKKVFEAIRDAKPPRLYIAADGPRPDKSGEKDRCEKVRSIATDVDWACEVKTLFRANNLGCNYGPSSAISWFFESEEEGIILEDDVLPLSSFFPYCDELLLKYRYDTRIAYITGCNLISNYIQSDESYFVSKYGHIWGWASWRRSWKFYDDTLKSWPEWRDNGGFELFANKNKHFVLYWKKIFDTAFYETVNFWDYQWTFNCWYNGMSVVVPVYNQIQNIGFGADSTHTGGSPPHFVKKSIPKLLSFPLHHPQQFEINTAAVDIFNKKVLGFTKINQIKKIPFIMKILNTINIAIKKIKGIF